MSEDKYCEHFKINFIDSIATLTGLSRRKLLSYATSNNLFNILEHPYTIEPNKHQLEKINILNEFIVAYKLLKFQENDTKVQLDSSAKAGEYFKSILSGIKDQEKFLAAFLDNGNNVIETRLFAEGNIGEAIVYPRNILKAALDCDCRSLILAHNHPGGSLMPSKRDIEFTENILSIFEPLHIKLLDHIIVADTKYYSISEKSVLLNKVNANYDPVTFTDHEKKKGVKEASQQFYADTEIGEIDGEEECEWEI